MFGKVFRKPQVNLEKPRVRGCPPGSTTHWRMVTSFCGACIRFRPHTPCRRSVVVRPRSLRMTRTWWAMVVSLTTSYGDSRSITLTRQYNGIPRHAMSDGWFKEIAEEARAARSRIPLHNMPLWTRSYSVRDADHVPQIYIVKSPLDRVG